MDNREKITGFLRSAVITAVIFLFLSFLFKGVVIILSVFMAKLGDFASIAAVILNTAGAAFSAWASARIAVAGRKMKPKMSGITALFLAIVLSLLELASGIGGDFVLLSAGREASFLSSVLQAIGFFAVIFLISRSVFKKREAEPEKEKGTPKEKLSFEELLGLK
ncbi:MAG: hypothetical protein PHP35_00340 [Candidatus Colwellbacteria bacterium]|nr:hypothetical protein [Candidatus Colwellbacteria bacterium]